MAAVGTGRVLLGDAIGYGSLIVIHCCPLSGMSVGKNKWRWTLGRGVGGGGLCQEEGMPVGLGSADDQRLCSLFGGWMAQEPCRRVAVSLYRRSREGGQGFQEQRRVKSTSANLVGNVTT